MKLRTIKDISSIRGKFVLLRDDLNVQIIDGKITEPFRIEQSMPTIEYLRKAGAKIVICSHLGKPKGKNNSEFTLKPIADFMKIPFIPDCLDKDFMKDMQNGDTVLLENLRFYAEEESNSPTFAKKLAEGFDIFVNDAFAVCHRAHASTVGITEFLPSFAGELLTTEISNLDSMMFQPQHPLLSIVAGSKISTKIGVLKALAEISDTLITDGALGTTFNYAMGEKVGKSLYEPEQKETALQILDYAKQHNCRVMLPIDKGVAKEFTRSATRSNKTLAEIEDDDVIIDSGLETTARNIAEIKKAKTVIWNGTVGMAEWMPTWSVGSFALARAIAEQTRNGKLKSFVGGGDTVAALDACGVRQDITYVSTGGGAFLEFIEKRRLPGIEVLQNL